MSKDTEIPVRDKMGEGTVEERRGEERGETEEVRKGEGRDRGKARERQRDRDRERGGRTETK